MAHPLVLQLHFTRSEFLRGLDGLSESDAQKRLLPMNSISWIVGHLAEQEQRNWLTRLHNQTPLPYLYDLFSYGAPASTPPFSEVKDAWHVVIKACEPFLDRLTPEDLLEPIFPDGESPGFSVGTFMQRIIYHYWYHIGEILAVRQMLGHEGLPDFAGDINKQAPFQYDVL